MASLQEQIDTLRERVVAVQGSLATRALTSAMITLNTQISEDLDTLTTTYTDLGNCVTELQDALLAARQELMDLKAA